MKLYFQRLCRYLPFAIVGLLLTLSLTACGENTSANPTVPASSPTTLATTALTAPTTASVATTRPTTAQPTLTLASPKTNATTTRNGATTAATEPSLTDTLPERAVVRSFTDDTGRPIKLTFGRGNGHGGDYGWAHIYGKHVQGIWYDGGTITTFPKAINTKSPEEVVGLIGKSLQDKSPDNAGNGRRSYVYAVPGTTRDVFTVVGSDGTIITSYPVPHGSKDENS